jgi:CheY-like chemotaxis protein
LRRGLGGYPIKEYNEINMPGQVLKDKKILVVDDEDFVRNMFKRYLAVVGAEVEGAENGKKALETLKTYKPDMIMLDLIMPEMDGCMTLEALKANPETKDIPVMILTNLDDQPEHIDRARSLGVSDYVRKTDASLDEIGDRILKGINDWANKLPAGGQK